MIDAISPNLLADLLAFARREGADDGDAVGVTEVSSEVRVRMGEVETSSRAEQHEVGLRLFVGQRSAIVSSNDLRDETLRGLVRHAIAAARQMDADVDSRVPRREELDEAPPELPLADDAVAAYGPGELIDLARRAERAALDADVRIVNSEGGEASAGERALTLVTMGGVTRSRRSTSIGVVAVPVAAHDGAMEVDYWFASRRRLADLPTPESVGAFAAERALRRLGARSLSTRAVPVIFEAPVASRILGDFVSGLSGERVARGSSYLTGRLGEVVAHEAISLVDDPTLPWGVASRSFDGEGFASRPHALVEGGRLVGYLTNLRTAARIGCGHGRNASRGTGAAPSVSPTHVHLAAGEKSLAALIAELGEGLLVTSTMGHGTDLVRGAYSQGAAGWWFEGGELAYPVSEVTVAGEFDTLMRTIIARADDLDVHRGVSAPSFAVAKLTVAGAG
jgi:PmbA protein